MSRQARPESADRGKEGRSRVAIWTAFAAFLLAASLSFLARGMAGDEEVGHYLIARFAPQKPDLFLSLVGRPLPTLAMTLAAQLGFVAARLPAALATALTVFGVTRLLRRTDWLPPACALPLVFLQPFVLAHAGTAMTEPYSTLLVTWAFVAWIERRPLLLAGLASLAALARFELILFWPIVAWVLLRWNRARLALLLPLPLLLWALLAWTAYGDPLWLVHATEVRVYNEQQPTHYLERLGWILGPGLVLPVLLGAVLAVASLLKRKASDRRRGAPLGVAVERRRVLSGSLLLAIGALLLYTALAWWRPITGGNLRYLAGFAGPLALLAAAGFGELGSPRSRRVLIVTFATLLLTLGPWGHAFFADGIAMSKLDPLPAVAVLLVYSSAWIRPASSLLPLAVALVLSSVALVRGYSTTLHWSPSQEQSTAMQAGRDALARGLTGNRIFAAHPVIHWSLGTNPYDPESSPPVNDETPDKAPPGSILFWDTHYMRGRGASLGVDTFLTRTDWEFISGHTAPDTSWSCGIFRRRAPSDAGGPPSTSTPSMGGSAKTVGSTAAARAWAREANAALLYLGHIRKILAIDPGAVDRWRFLAQNLLAAGRLSEAQAAFERARQIEPEDPDNEIFLSSLAERQGRYPEALAAIDRAIARKPTNGEYHFHAALLLARMKDATEARRHFLTAARRLPKRWDVQYAAGSFLFRVRDLRSAEECLVRAQRLRPGSVEGAILAAESIRRQGRFVEAEKRLRELVRRQPRASRGYLVLGDFLASRGRRAEAVEVWRAGVKKTNDPKVRARLGGP